jgi:exosome complex component RRP45
MSSTGYIAIRDDGGLSSLSVNERDFLRDCALRGERKDHDDDDDDHDVTSTSKKKNIFRADGRRSYDVRNIRLRLHRWDNGAETTVQWGMGTRVTAQCTAQLIPPPSPDRPNEGVVVFEVDLSPMASPGFRLAPAVSTGGGTSKSSSNFSNQEQRLVSNRILRCLERIIIIGGALDAEALVLESGKWVWKLTVSITVLDAGGNILDASVLAAVAALRHYRKPQVDMTSSVTASANEDEINVPTLGDSILLPTLIPSTIKEATPLPLHHSPLSISFGLIPADDAVHSNASTSIVAALMDPTDREELVQSGCLTIAMNTYLEICLLDYGGGCELTTVKLKECCQAAQVAIKELCQLLETTLAQADQHAQEERLRLLQLHQQAHNLVVSAAPAGSLPPLPSTTSANIPFLQQLDDSLEVDAKVDDSQLQQVQTAAEEAYRKQALDYAFCHIAATVQDDNDNQQKHPTQAGSSLLASMLKSVGPQQPLSKGGTTAENDSVKESHMTSKSQNITTTDDFTNAKGNRTVNVATSSPTTNSLAKPVAMDLEKDEDDEEEETLVLHSEFESVQKKATLHPSIKNDVMAANDKGDEEEEEPNIDDLAMAIKSKKAKRKKQKKK